MSKDKFVVKELKEAAELYKERNETYGDNYKRVGKLMLAYFPNGIELKTEKDFIRYSMFSAVVNKMFRYAAQFNNGGHYDSARDAAVYAMMLNEVDHENE